MLRGKIEELLKREAAGEDPVNLGEQDNPMIPMIHGGAEIEQTLARAGDKARKEFRLEMGNVMYGMQKLMGKLQPLINPGNRP